MLVKRALRRVGLESVHDSVGRVPSRVAGASSASLKAATNVMTHKSPSGNVVVAEQTRQEPPKKSKPAASGKLPFNILRDTARFLDDLAKVHPAPEYVREYANDLRWARKQLRQIIRRKRKPALTPGEADAAICLLTLGWTSRDAMSDIEIQSSGLNGPWLDAARRAHQKIRAAARIAREGE